MHKHNHLTNDTWSFWQYSKLSNSGNSLNWSIIDEVTTRNTTAYFYGPLSIYHATSRVGNNGTSREICPFADIMLGLRVAYNGYLFAVYFILCIYMTI